jgi:hypothetical protein
MCVYNEINGIFRLLISSEAWGCVGGMEVKLYTLYILNLDGGE